MCSGRKGTGGLLLGERDHRKAEVLKKKGGKPQKGRV